MKTREQVQKEILAFPQKHVLLALPTGFGKTAIALRRTYSANPTSVLVVYPKVNLKQTWVDEYGKWGYEDKLENVTFTTYASKTYSAETDNGKYICYRAIDSV